MRRSSLLAGSLLPAIILVTACALEVASTRNGHDWGDDFAQYVMHARNLATGRPYARGIQGIQGPAGQDAQLPIGNVIELPQGTTPPAGFVLLGYETISVTQNVSGTGKQTKIVLAVWQKEP